jgi:hypothetical protein
MEIMMKREILDAKRGLHISGCCPGHDDFPIDSYRNRRSKHARSRDKKNEHKYVRRIKKLVLKTLTDE